MSRQVPVKGVAFVALVAVVAATLAGCGSTSTASLPAAASATAGVSSASQTAASSASSDVEQLAAQAMMAPIDVSQAGPSLDRADQAAKDAMRGLGGVALALGSDGGMLLAEIDAGEKEAIALLVARIAPQSMVSGSGSLGVVGQLAPPASARLVSAVLPTVPGGAGRLPPQAGFEAFGSVAALTMLAPNWFATAPRDASGNAAVATVTQDTTTANGARIHFSMTPTISGSALTADVRMTVDVAGPPAYQETATGTINVDLCPDAGGNVPLKLTLGGGFSLFGGGMQYTIGLAATGHVDDSGKLASLDMQTDGSLAMQPMTTGTTGSEPMYVEMRFSYSAGADGGGFRNFTGTAPRYSSRVNVAFAEATRDMILNLGTIAAYMGIQAAQDQWTKGYCLEIAVPSMGAGASQTVAAGSTTPFTANVRHKFDHAALVVPVTATLGSGGVSVSPSGNPVPAPAAFRYKAPDQDRQTATVNLETHSKRGIANLAATFRTGLSAYRASWQDQGTTWSGVVCGLDQPFTITVVSPGGDLTIPFEFAPSGPDSGTVSFDVTKYGTHWQGAGPYEVKAADAGQLNLVGQIRGSYTASGQTGYYPIPFDVPLTPLTTNECGQG